MSRLNIGVFSELESAENAVSELENMGYDSKSISLIAKDNESIRKIVKKEDTPGAETGAVLGGLAGLLLGLGVFTIPGVGALFIAGPLLTSFGLSTVAATTISGAVTGALAGGLVGALVDLGIPEVRAKEYEIRINNGSILLLVPSKLVDGMDESRGILERNGAEEIDQIDSPVNY